jgi:uncharacterized protein DUF4430
MNKKLVVIIAVIAISLLLWVGYNTVLTPKGVEGEKEVTVNVVNENEDIDESFTYDTGFEFLFELLEEHEEELGMEYQTSEFGTMLTGMMNYTADNSKQEYFHIYVNGEDAATGVDDITLKDGDIYKFELKNY